MTDKQFQSDALDNIREYFEDRADASCEPGDDRFRGNKEMDLLRDVDTVEAELAAAQRGLAALKMLGAAQCPNRCADGMMISTGPDPLYEPCPWCDARDALLRCGQYAPNPSGQDSAEASPSHRGEASGPGGLGPDAGM